MVENQNQELVNLASLVKSYVLTEKTTKLYDKDNSHYTFIVDPSLKKTELKSLFELLFSVKIKSIRTLNLFAQKKRVGKFIGKKRRAKKVYITLQPNQEIKNIFN